MATKKVTDIIDDYWYKHYVSLNGSGGHCSLCGNHGILDSTGQKTPAGYEVGRKNFCICPNGRAMRDICEKNLPKDGSLLVTNQKRLPVKKSKPI